MTTELVFRPFLYLTRTETTKALEYKHQHNKIWLHRGNQKSNNM